MSIKWFLNTPVLMKSGYLSTARVLPSGKAALCFILTHIHYDHTRFFQAWSKCISAPIIDHFPRRIFIDILKGKQHFLYKAPIRLVRFFDCQL